MINLVIASVLCAAAFFTMRLAGAAAARNPNHWFWNNDILMSLMAAVYACFIAACTIYVTLTLYDHTLPVWEPLVVFIGANALGYYAYPAITRVFARRRSLDGQHGAVGHL